MVWSANPDESGTRPHQRRARSAEAISIITILLSGRSNFLLILSYQRQPPRWYLCPWWDCGRIHYADAMLKGQIIGMNVLTSRHWFQNSRAGFNWTTHFRYLQPTISDPCNLELATSRPVQWMENNGQLHPCAPSRTIGRSRKFLTALLNCQLSTFRDTALRTTSENHRDN